MFVDVQRAKVKGQKGFAEGDLILPYARKSLERALRPRSGPEHLISLVLLLTLPVVLSRGCRRHCAFLLPLLTALKDFQSHIQGPRAAEQTSSARQQATSVRLTTD